MSSQTPRIAVVGGGIAGLSFALHLHQRGLACDVYESVPEVRELGVGITLLPHAMRELAALGLQPALDTLSPRDHLVGHQRVYDLSSLESDLRASGFEPFERRAREAAKGGKLMLYGGLEGSFSPPPLQSMYQRSLWFHAYSLFNYVEDLESQRRGVEFVTKALESGKLKPRIDKVFAMEEYVEAWRYLRGKRSSYGKVMIETGA